MNLTPKVKVIIAVIVVALIWGTTFLGIKISVETIPPWFVAGLRQLIAAIILLVFLLMTKRLKWIGRENFLRQIILSTLMLVCANGLTTVAESSVSSSLASLISSLSPVLVFFGSLILGLEKFSYKAAGGLLLALFGAVLIFWNGIADLANPQYRQGVLVMCLSITGWAAGTVYTKKSHYPNDNIFLNLFYQFAFAGVVQVVIALLFYKNHHFEAWSWQSISAMLYLAVFGSVVAFFAFNYALKSLKPTQISMLSYVNTVIAIFLGWLVLNEKITLKFLLATAFIITGMLVMNYKKSKADNAD